MSLHYQGVEWCYRHASRPVFDALDWCRNAQNNSSFCLDLRIVSFGTLVTDWWYPPIARGAVTGRNRWRRLVSRLDNRYKRTTIYWGEKGKISFSGTGS